MGATESLLLTDPFVVTLLRNFCRGRLPGDRLSSHSPGLLRKRLADTLEQLGLVVPYRWYSVHRGGATHIYRTTNNIAAVCVRGRWNAVKTAKIYISDGVAQLSELTLSPSKQRRLRQLAISCRPDSLSLSLSLPPSLYSLYSLLYLSIHASRPSIHPSIYLSIGLSVYLAVYPSVGCLSVCLPICLSVYPCICLSIHLIDPPIHPSIHLSIGLSIYLST